MISPIDWKFDNRECNNCFYSTVCFEVGVRGQTSRTSLMCGNTASIFYEQTVCPCSSCGKWFPKQQ